MKLKFKQQAYQTHAVEAVADCFLGQPKNSGVSYRIDPGRGDDQTFLGIDESGFKNSDLAISLGQLLTNVHGVQLRQNLPLSSDAGINVMVINVQAFNARGQDARRIYEERDDFLSRRLIDVISRNRPIVILDEPQKMEGAKTMDALRELTPLMILRWLRQASGAGEIARNR